jgi:CBS domain-containing protein
VDGPEQEKTQLSRRALEEAYGSSIQKDDPQLRRRLWKVGNLMTRAVKTLRPEDPLKRAWEMIEGTGFRHIPITNRNGKIEGLLSDRDLLPLNKIHASEKPISEIMTIRVLTCFSDSPLREAASIMMEEGFSSLPVVNVSGELLGLLTTSDILKALVREAPLDIWT